MMNRAVARIKLELDASDPAAVIRWLAWKVQINGGVERIRLQLDPGNLVAVIQDLTRIPLSWQRRSNRKSVCGLPRQPNVWRTLADFTFREQKQPDSHDTKSLAPAKDRKPKPTSCHVVRIGGIWTPKLATRRLTNANANPTVMHSDTIRTPISRGTARFPDQQRRLQYYQYQTGDAEHPENNNHNDCAHAVWFLELLRPVAEKSRQYVTPNAMSEIPSTRGKGGRSSRAALGNKRHTRRLPWHPHVGQRIVRDML